MAVVGAEHDVAFAGMLQDVVEVVGGLASNEHVVFLQRVHAEPPLALLGETQLGVVEGVGDPLGADLDEAPAHVWELFGNALHQEVMEGADDGELELREAGVPGEEVPHIEVALGGVEADGHVQLAGLPVEGKEVGVSHALVVLAVAHEDAAGAVLLGPVQLLQGLVHAHMGEYGSPAQPALAHVMDVRDPAVVASAERKLGFRAAGEGPEEDGGIEDMGVDAELIHVSDARGDV